MKLIRYEYPQTPGTSAFNRLFDIGMTSAFERFGNLFDDFMGWEAGFRQPAVDLYEDDHSYYARLELPGLKKNEIDLELENSVLTISSTKSEETKDVKSSYSFQRSLSVPDGVALNKLSAKYEDGILTVAMPKEESRKARQITVK